MTNFVDIDLLFEDAQIALNRGICEMLNRPLKSLIYDNAVGWHMFWTEPDTIPGVYATCDTLFLISQVPKDLIHHDLLNRIWKTAFDNNLCRQMDFGDKSTKSDAEKRVKEINNFILYKQAKFLEAASFSKKCSSKSKSVIKSVYLNLLKLRRKDGSWSDTITSNNSSVMATTFVARAISLYPETSYDKLKLSLDYLIEIATLNPYTIKNIIALECLTFIKKYSNKQISDNLVLPQISTSELITELEEEDTFPWYFKSIHLPNFPNTAYINRNRKLVSCLCILRLIEQSLLIPRYLLWLSPCIHNIIIKIQANGVYCAPNRSSPHHWETAEALLVLIEFIRIIRNKLKFKELKGMLVTPHVFPNQHYSVDPSLVFIIMPFEKDLLENVLPVFSKAVEDANLGLHAITSEMDWSNPRIMDGIWENINRASFIIADCTRRNPNVFYEIGISHTIGKFTFLCGQQKKDFPFDISGIRSHNYKDLSYNSMQKLSQAIVKFLTEGHKLLING